MIEGGLHPKERKLPKLTNIGPQDPNLIASWDMVKDVNEVDQQQISGHRINLLGDLAIQEYDEFDAITEDTFARYPRFRDLGFDIDR